MTDKICVGAIGGAFGVRGEVRLDGVSFRYAGADRDALAGVSVDVPAGSSLALVGHTGSGKSTLAALVARLHDLVRDETAVEHVADDVAADGREHEPDGVDVLTADEGDHRPADGGEDRRDGDHDLLPPGDGARGFDRDGGQPRIAVEGVET